MKKANNRIEMVGNTYNSWLILEHTQTVNKIPFYRAKCLGECGGTEHIVRGQNVRNGSSRQCVPCGLKAGKKKIARKPRGTKTSLNMAEQRLYGIKKKSAKKRGLNWAISYDFFLNSIYKICHYCDRPPQTTTNPLLHMGYSPEREKESTIVVNGFDRINSDLGYTETNVVTCCEQCNRAKLDYTVEEFLEWGKAFATKQGWLK